MFHWICPECGQEIAPGVKECPVCEPQASASAPAMEVVAPAPAAVLAAPAIVYAEPIVEPVPEPPVVIQAEEVILRPEVILKPEVVEKPKPRATLPEPETFADRLVDLAEQLHGERVPYAAPRTFPGTAGSSPPNNQPAERAPVILDVAAADVTPAKPSLAPPPTVLLLAEPEPPSIAAAFPPEHVFRTCAAESAARSLEPTGAVPSAPDPIRFPGSAPASFLAEPQPPSLASEIPMLGIFDPRPAECSVRSLQPIEAELSGLCVILGPVRLPVAPDRVAAPGLAPLEDYFEAADRLMRPADCPINPATPRVVLNVTLPGPSLPQELVSLQAAGLIPIPPGRARQATSPNPTQGWNTKLVVVGILLTAGLAATYSVMPGTSPSSPPKPNPDPGPEKPILARSANSLARFVEVTGVRFVELNRKPQIQYLVVNHSSAPLSSVTVYVTLRTSSWKPGQPPLSRFSFRSPALEAFEAKEMASPIERVTGSFEMPDWQDLHVDVEVQ